MKLLCYFISFFLILSPLYGVLKKKHCDFVPVFYGTLLELPSYNNDPGQVTFETYLYGGFVYGAYNNDWSLNKQLQAGTLNPQLFIYTGITKSLQALLVVQSQSVFFNHRSKTHLGDSFFGFGWQWLWEKPNTAQPNVRLSFGEGFPTGKYKNLNPFFQGADSSGQGAYATIIALVIDKTFYTNPCHPFNININLFYTHYLKTTLRGINTYGGGLRTKGVLGSGNTLLTSLSLEYCFTQKYLLALDLQYTHTFPTDFHGVSGFNPDGTLASIFTDSKDLFTITPAIEFGITPTMCFYIGGYFTAAGRNTTASAEGNMTFEVLF